MSCKEEAKFDIHSGDILFRGTDHLGLSEAINKVTKTKSSTNYTHIGVCQVVNDTIWVYHAAPEKGVCKEPLELFCQPDKQTKYLVDLFRLKETHKPSVNTALIEAKRHVGKPYDYTYILSGEGFYCSEFIYEIFKKDSIFRLNPMTFVDPDTKEFHDGWVSHYNNLGIDIPEGQSGCNPNEMATSTKLKFIERIYFSDNKVLN